MIKTIEIEIGDTTVKVTPEQLRALFDGLKEHFHEAKEVHHHYPTWQWTYPPLTFPPNVWQATPLTGTFLTNGGCRTFTANAPDTTSARSGTTFTANTVTTDSAAKLTIQ